MDGIGSVCFVCSCDKSQGLITLELAVAVYRLFIQLPPCSRRSWVAPPVSAPSQPASLHRLAQSPTAFRQPPARLFFRANADSRQARLHARPTVTRTAPVSLLPQPSQTYPPRARQSRVLLPATSQTPPVATPRPQKMRLSPTCPVCLRLSTSSLRVCTELQKDENHLLTFTCRHHPVVILQSPPSTQLGLCHSARCRHDSLQHHL
jgi:hypothetical protein